MANARSPGCSPDRAPRKPAWAATSTRRTPAPATCSTAPTRCSAAPLSALCFEGPRRLNSARPPTPSPRSTSRASPASSGRARAGASAGEPAFVAGHSLGEYTRARRGRRAELRGRAPTRRGARPADAGGRRRDARRHGGASSASTKPRAQAVCDEAGAELCNINAPGQIVIGGAKDAVARACALALERGARRAIPLDVGGAFHTSLMQPAVAAMTRGGRGARRSRAPRVPRRRERHGAADDGRRRASRDELVFQLTHPVRWVQCVEYMAAHGVTDVRRDRPGTRAHRPDQAHRARHRRLRNINGAASLAA